MPPDINMGTTATMDTTINTIATAASPTTKGINRATPTAIAAIMNRGLVVRIATPDVRIRSTRVAPRLGDEATTVVHCVPREMREISLQGLGETTPELVCVVTTHYARKRLNSSVQTTARNAIQIDLVGLNLEATRPERIAKAGLIEMPRHGSLPGKRVFAIRRVSNGVGARRTRLEHRYSSTDPNKTARTAAADRPSQRQVNPSRNRSRAWHRRSQSRRSASITSSSSAKLDPAPIDRPRGEPSQESRKIRLSPVQGNRSPETVLDDATAEAAARLLNARRPNSEKCARPPEAVASVSTTAGSP